MQLIFRRLSVTDSFRACRFPYAQLPKAYTDHQRFFGSLQDRRLLVSPQNFLTPARYPSGGLFLPGDSRIRAPHGYPITSSWPWRFTPASGVTFFAGLLSLRLKLAAMGLCFVLLG